MSSRTDALHHMSFQSLMDGGRASAADAVPPHRRVLTPAERRAEESTRIAREATETAAEKRQAQVAKLKAAREAHEGEVAAEKAAEKAAKAAAPKAKRVRKAG
jgi:hypothetical protein